MKRIVIIGTSGAGKTHLAQELSKIFDCPFIWLDELSWLPDWQMRPRDELKELVAKKTAASRWVVDGNYGMIRDVIWPKATHIIWLNYSFPVIFGRCLKRTIKRIYSGEKLFKGENRETFLKSFFSTDSILVWVLKTFWKHRREYPELFKKPEYQHLEVIELNNQRGCDRFLEKFD